VQLTDTHLKAFAGGKLLGLDTDHSLQAVLDLVRAEYPAPDLLLGTGDLADSGAEDAYRRLLGYFGQLTPAHYWLPGNHDLSDVMLSVAGEQRLPGELQIGAWQVLMLDSQIPGEVGGHIGREELARLEAALIRGAAAGHNALVCLHHQPIPIGCSWLDQQMVSDSRAFFEVIGRFPMVRGVLWGHVHQELQRVRDGLLLMCTPSTCVQFLPGQEDFSLDSRAPGYRWLELHADGRIVTGVSRLRDYAVTVDHGAGGYL